MKKIFDKFLQTWVSGKSYIKVVLVFLAFLLMIYASCFIMARTLTGKLLEHTDESVNDVQSFLSNTLAGPEAAINFIADTIQGMILRGESFELIQAYMAECSTDRFKEKMPTITYNSVYGFFDVFNAFYDGTDWMPADDYLPRERPWYTTALNSGDKAVISPVYTSANWNTPVIGYTRRLSDGEGRLLGVVSINVPVDFINQIIADRRITEGSYGFILDDQLMMIAHPSAEVIGEVLGTSYDNIAQHKDSFLQGHDITIRGYTSYYGTKSLLFARQVDNGWYVCFVVPEAEYYKELYEMMVIISILGVFLAWALSMLLVNIDIARNKADIKNQQKSNFLAVMSHEIRTPMNAIMGIAEMQLQEHDETFPANLKEAFERIYYSGSLLLQIISDILDLSKIESGKLEIIPDRYEAASLINEVVHLNKIRFDSKPVEFKLHVDENTPASLIGDELRIKQIINNLLSNAFKYTWKGEVELIITTKPGPDASADESFVTLVITVRDTGQGIAPQDIKNIFDEYTRLNLKANRSTVGTGLGLSITRNLVAMMQGEIFVESELEKGSVFTVHLPQRINGSSAVLGKALVDNLQKLQFSSVSHMKKTPILRKQMPYGSILIVDDVEMNLFVAKLLMRPYGLKIDTASSGYEAIDRIKNGNVYDVIFMDHMMPKMDGIEAMKIIRSLGYTHPVIALTANAVAGQADIFLSNGFDDFISKPIDIRILDAALNKYVRDKQKEDESMINEPAVQDMPQNPGQKPVDLKNIPGLDFEKGLDIFEGEMDDYMSALHSFAKNAPDIIDKLRGVTKENLPEYAINVHGFKSTSAWICAENIRQGALELETLAKAGDFSAVAARNDTFLDDADTFVKSLKAALDQNSGG